jgi:CDP-diglyceride synthetase
MEITSKEVIASVFWSIALLYTIMCRNDEFYRKQTLYWSWSRWTGVEDAAFKEYIEKRIEETRQGRQVTVALAVVVWLMDMSKYFR